MPGITVVDAERTFWDKVVILHGLRRWHEIRGQLRGDGQRISRHYYDLFRLGQSEIGQAALANRALGEDCVAHARMFFNRPDFDLAAAQVPTFALCPEGGMRRFYPQTVALSDEDEARLEALSTEHDELADVGATHTASPMACLTEADRLPAKASFGFFPPRVALCIAKQKSRPAPNLHCVPAASGAGPIAPRSTPSHRDPMEMGGARL